MKIRQINPDEGDISLDNVCSPYEPCEDCNLCVKPDAENYVVRVLMCGSRTFTDIAPIKDTIDRLVKKVGAKHVVIIEGGAKGADALARAYADWHTEDGMRVETYHADWNKYGRRAGFIRNKRMLDEGKPDYVFAFKDKDRSVGTDMMVDLARKAGVSTYVYMQDNVPVGEEPNE